MVLFGQNWLYSGKSCCMWAKLLYSGKSGFNRAKVLVFGETWLYSGKSSSIRQKLFYSGKMADLGKVVVFGQKWF